MEQGGKSREQVYKLNERLLHKAVDLGINYFDTADIYNKGENETTVGQALRAKRKEVYLATKVGNQLRPDGSGWDWNPRKEYILQAVEGSLKRLQTDYIDLYQLHGGTIEDPIDETIEAFELLKQQGKIRAYGISSIRPNVIREYVKRSSMVSVMMQYSLLDRRPEESCLGLLEKNNIAVMVRGAVAKGLLVNKPPKEYLGYPQEAVARMAGLVAGIEDQGQRSGEQSPGVRLEAQEVNMDSSANETRSPAQTAIQFALRGPAVCSVVAGMRNQEQLMENAGATAATRLTEQEYQQLRLVLEPNKYLAHR
ncbi:MAG: putative oxidoreductase YqkF [Cyclobacteriaceae bacterium]|nr:MAG: putative oxidoreductase YqkF [Cyclobacteriaceae bacterium]